MTKPLSPLQVALLYLASAAIVVLTLAALQPSATAFGWYFCISFWAVLTADVLITHASAGARFSFADRFIGYLFAAPFIWPARLLRLVQTKSKADTFART